MTRQRKKDGYSRKCIKSCWRKWKKREEYEQKTEKQAARGDEEKKTFIWPMQMIHLT